MNKDCLRKYLKKMWRVIRLIWSVLSDLLTLKALVDLVHNLIAKF